MEGIQIIGNVKVTVKTFTDAKELDVQEDATIKEFREEVCKAFDMTKDQFRLICGGRLLEDKDTLKGLKLTDGSSVYLLPKSKPQAPPEMPTMGVVNGASFARLQTKLQETLTANPEMLNSLLSNSTVQQLIANPEVMKSLILNNPLCKDMLESNPDINQILNDSELLRQNVKLAQNQSLLHKMVAGQHRDALNEGDQSSGDVDMLASEQLSDPAPADMFTTALHMPYMQDMLVAMSQNKDLAKKVMLNSPICTGNPELQRYMTQTCPNLLNQLANKNIQAMFTNPALFTTSLQVHDAMVRLNQEEPSLFASSNMSGVTMPPPTAADNARPVVLPAPTSKAGEPLEQLMHKALDKMCTVKVGPEQCYAFQLEQLASMGFTDQKRNLAAVLAANGDIATAVDSLKK